MIVVEYNTDTKLVVRYDRSLAVIEVEIAPAITMPVTLIPIGAPGPEGPPGPAGTSYAHNQSSASSTWTINHNLGYNPVIQLFTVGGVEFDAQVTNVSINQAVVSLVTPLAGQARCI